MIIERLTSNHRNHVISPHDAKNGRMYELANDETPEKDKTIVIPIAYCSEMQAGFIVLTRGVNPYFIKLKHVSSVMYLRELPLGAGIMVVNE